MALLEPIRPKTIEIYKTLHLPTKKYLCRGTDIDDTLLSIQAYEVNTYGQAANEYAHNFNNKCEQKIIPKHVEYIKVWRENNISACYLFRCLYKQGFTFMKIKLIDVIALD